MTNPTPEQPTTVLPTAPTPAPAAASAPAAPVPDGTPVGAPATGTNPHGDGPGAGRVALVTGGSSGIGEATARTLAQAGYTVYAAARRTDRMAGLAEYGVHAVELDVTDDASAKRCVDRIVAEQGRIDVLVNNAGYGSYGAIEDVPLDEARRQLEVNVIGLGRMTQLVLPLMRVQRSGTIVNISSMGGKMYTTLGGWYHATKHAVEALSDCLRLETRDFGIDVVVIEPGGIRTDWGPIAADHLEKASGSGPYAKLAARQAKSLRTLYSGTRLTDPQVIAGTILTAVTAERPKTRYAVGFMARPAIAARRLLGDRGFDRFIRLAGS